MFQWEDRGPYHHYHVLGVHQFEASGPTGKEGAGGRGRPKKENHVSEVVLSVSNWRFVRDCIHGGLTEFKPVTEQDVDVSIKMSSSVFKNTEKYSQWPFFDKHGLTVTYPALVSLLSDFGFQESLMAPLVKKYEQDLNRPILTGNGTFQPGFSLTEHSRGPAAAQSSEMTPQTRDLRSYEGSLSDCLVEVQNLEKRDQGENKKGKKKPTKTSEKKRKSSVKNFGDGGGSKKNKVSKVLLPALEEAATPENLRAEREPRSPTLVFSSDSEQSDNDSIARTLKKKKQKNSTTAAAAANEDSDVEVTSTPPEQIGSNYEGSLNPHVYLDSAAFLESAIGSIRKKKTRGKH